MLWQVRARTLGGTLCALLTACSVGTPYRRPDIALPPSWSAQADGNAAPRETIWPSPSWWQDFGSPRLDQLIAQARERNDDVAGAIARVQEADAQLRIAGAPLLPSAYFNATAVNIINEIRVIVNSIINTIRHYLVTRQCIGAVITD